MGSRLILTLFLSLALLPTPVLFAGPEEGAEEERGAFDAMVRADFPAAAEIYIGLLKKHPRSPLADYYLFRALENAARAGRSGTGLAAAAMDAAVAGDHPVASAQVAWMRAGGLLRKGKIGEAEAEAASLGFLREWAVIGPFENEGEAGFHEAYGPEKGLKSRTGFMDYKVAHDGKQGKCRWYVVGQKHPLHLLDLKKLFRLTDNVCAYACTYVRAPEPLVASLRLGSEGAVKVWVNGSLRFAGDTYRAASLDQDVAGLALAEGWNEVLVKTCQKKGPWTLRVRLTRPDGSPVEDVEASPDPSSLGKDEKRAGGEAEPGAPPDEGAVGVLRGACRADGTSALTLSRYAYMLHARRCLDENDRTVRDLLLRAVEKDPRSAILRLMLSAAEVDRNRALAQVLEARALAPGAALPTFALSRFYGCPRPIEWGWFFFGGEEGATTQEEYARIREVEMPEKERALLGEALKVRPDYMEALEALACHYFRLAGGNPRNPHYISPGKPFALEAKRRIQKALSFAGSDPRLLRMLNAFEHGDPADAVSKCRGALAANFLDASARKNLVQALLKLGRLDEAVGVLGDRIRINPFDWGALREIAKAYRAWDCFDRSAGYLEIALSVCPENVEVLKELGDLSLVMGDREKALASFRRALEIRPQEAQLERRLRYLLPETEAEFYTPFRADLKPVIEAALASRPLEKVAAVVAFKNDVIRILPNGMAKHFHQRVVKVLTEKGVNENRWVRAWPGRFDYYTGSRGEVKTARLYRAGAPVMEGSYREGGTYASFDELKEGDVLVFEVKIEEIGDPPYKGYFGSMLLLQDGTNPVRESRVTFLHPPEKPLHFHAVGVASPPVAGKSGDLLARTWVVKDVPEVK
ncbi:MAG: DUF3857 domain-containing protein, partial [Planctomycetota bacterium]